MDNQTMAREKLQPTDRARLASGTQPSETSYRVVLFLLAAGMLAAWSFRLRSEIWVDESGTYWIIKDGLAQAFERATEFQGQSPAYYVLAWLCSQLFGLSEWALRLPSAALLLGTLWLLYLLGKRWFGAQTGAIAALILGCDSAQYALEARPYALGLLAVVGAWLFLTRWIDLGRRRDAIVYVLFAALLFYAHFIFSIVYALHLGFVWHESRQGKRRAPWKVALIGASVAALIAPGVPQLWSLFARRSTLNYAGTPGQAELAAGLIPTILVAAALLAGALAWATRTRPRFVPAAGAPYATWAFAWRAFPVLLLFALARTGISELYVERYYSCGAPGMALFAAWCIRGLTPVKLRVLLLGAFVTIHIARPVTAAYPTHWKQVVTGVRNAAEGRRIPVLIPPVFVEARQVAWVRDAEKSDYLLALVNYYRMPGELIAVPHRLSEESRRYLRDIIHGRLMEAQRFVWVSRREPTVLEAWLTRELALLPFSSSVVEAGGMMIHTFKRSSAIRSEHAEQHP